MKGVVKFYNDRRSYGFITGEDDKDVFVHKTGLERRGLKTATIAEGDNVEYEIKESDRGPIAINVKKIEAEEVKEVRLDLEVGSHLYWRGLNPLLIAASGVGYIACRLCGPGFGGALDS